jgi:hypothetical protein
VFQLEQKFERQPKLRKRRLSHKFPTREKSFVRPEFEDFRMLIRRHIGKRRKASNVGGSVARFFFVQYTKTGGKYQTDPKYTK